MFPSRSSLTTRAAFARPAPGRHPVTRRQRSYAALRLPCCVGRRSGFPSPSAYHGANACSEPAPRASADARRAGGVWGRGLRQPRSCRGQTGASQVTGPSSSSVPRSSTPPRETPPRPYSGDAPCCLQGWRPPGLPGRNHFGAASPRPTCSPAYASIKSLLARLQGWLPACRARLWPGGIRTRWTTDRISRNHRMIPSFRTSIAWSQPPNGFSGI